MEGVKRYTTHEIIGEHLVLDEPLDASWVRGEDYEALFEAAEKRAADLAARGAVGLQIASENLRAVSLELAAARRKIAELEAEKI